MLELAFASKSLREFCENKLAAETEFGLRVARTLRRRVADLRALDSVTEIPAGSPRERRNPHSGQYLIDLCDGRRMVLVANHREPPLDADGNVDWARVTRLKLLRIEDSHA